MVCWSKWVSYKLDNLEGIVKGFKTCEGKWARSKRWIEQFLLQKESQNYTCKLKFDKEMWGPRWFCDWCYQTLKQEWTDNLCIFFRREKWGGWGISHSSSEGWALQPTPQITTTANMARAALLRNSWLLYTPSMETHSMQLTWQWS